MMSGQDEECEIGVSSSKIVLLLMRKNTSSQEARGESRTEKIVTDEINMSFEADIEAKEEEKAVQSDGDKGRDEKACHWQEEEKRRREQERKKAEEQVRLRKEQKRREEEERKRAKKEEKWRLEQEAKAKEEEARALEEEARMKAEAEELRRREQRELEELAGMLRQSLEVEEAERQALAEEEEVRLRKGVVEAVGRKEAKKRKVTGERSRRPTMAREWRMLRQRRRSQDELRAKVEHESPLVSDAELPKPIEDQQIIIEQNSAVPDCCYAEKVPDSFHDSCYDENLPNCCYVEQVRGEEELKQMGRGEL